jgi:hypothetical protein
MRVMVKDCLLSSGQLVDLHHPVDLHDKQRASPYNRVLGRLESL